MNLTDTDNDGLDGLLVDDLDVPDSFVWQPRTQPAPTVQTHRHQPTRRRQEDHRARGVLAGVLDPLPAPGETVHIILPGNVPLGDVVWTVVDGTQLPGPLHVSTLGFGRAWIAGLVDRLRDGRITEATICCSDYFAKADAAEFQAAREILPPWAVTLVAGRTHAKVATFGTISMEGSANLRSCRSVENVAVTNDQNLARFHAKWISELAHKPTP